MLNSSRRIRRHNSTRKPRMLRFLDTLPCRNRRIKALRQCTLRQLAWNIEESSYLNLRTIHCAIILLRFLAFVRVSLPRNSKINLFLGMQDSRSDYGGYAVHGYPFPPASASGSFPRYGQHSEPASAPYIPPQQHPRYSSSANQYQYESKAWSTSQHLPSITEISHHTPGFRYSDHRQHHEGTDEHEWRQRQY
jgi:hypothetical protein